MAVAIVALAIPFTAEAGGPTEPRPPNYMIEIIPGVPLVFELEDKLPAETESVRFEIDGNPYLTDDFAPFGDFIPTTFIDRRGVSFNTVHDFHIIALPLFSEPITIAEYHLLVREMPVIPRFHPLPLVREGRRELVGLQLRGVNGRTRVKIWGRGFRQIPGERELHLRLAHAGQHGRTYTIRGGLTWRRGAVPHLIVSVDPHYKMVHGAFVRGRVYTGVLRTRRGGDTNIHQIGNPEWCTDEISRRHKPPRRRSCHHL